MFLLCLPFGTFRNEYQKWYKSNVICISEAGWTINRFVRNMPKIAVQSNLTSSPLGDKVNETESGR